MNRLPSLRTRQAALVVVTMLCAASPALAQTTLIRNVRVFDGETVSGPVDVLVADGRIASLGAARAAPAGADVVDGTGMTLLPGLIDAHTHAFGSALEEALVFGVTTELDMFTDARMAAALRAEQARAGGAPGRADLLSAGTLATAPGGHGTEYGMPIPTITRPDSAQAFVDARIEEGSDYIKLVYDDGALFGLDWPTLDFATMRALIDAAHARNRLALVHISTAQQAVDAIRAGADGLVHLFTDTLPSRDFIDAVREADAFVIPTLVVLKSITGVGGAAPLLEDETLLPYLIASTRANLRAAFPARGDADERFRVPLRTVAMLHEAGVPILAGTDAPNPGTAHGIAMHRELELLVEAGLTPVEALRAATSVPAALFGLPDRGRIAPGMRADLLLVRGDPTADITATRAIEAVWKGGIRLDRSRWAEAAAASLAVSAPAGIPDDGMIADFEQGLTVRFGTGFAPNTDSFAGGSSSVSIDVADAGAGGSGHALRVSGTITGQLAYAWAGVMWSPTPQMMQPADLSAFDGVQFAARGDGRTHRVLVFSQSRGAVPLIHEFTPGTEWSTFELPWSTLEIDGSDVSAILFVGAPPPGEFWFEVDDVKLMRR